MARHRGCPRGVRLNGITGLAITKLDVLSGHETLKIADSYEVNGRQATEMPPTIREIQAAKPLYKEFPGWKEEIDQVHSVDDLPQAARDYVKKMEELTETPAMLVSVGPDRTQTLLLRNPFEK